MSISKENDELLSQLTTTTVSKEFINPSKPLKSRGHVLFEQIVEAAEIEAIGNIICMENICESTVTSKNGSVFFMYGSSKNTKIFAKKSCFIKFCNQARVEADTIVIESFAENSHLEAQSRIIGEEGEKSILRGGHLMAKELIICHEVGFDDQRETKITIHNQDGRFECKRAVGNITLSIGKMTTKLPTPCAWEYGMYFQCSGGKIECFNHSNAFNKDNKDKEGL